MSSKKIDRALYGPSWTEVILGAFLSFALGVALAAATIVLHAELTVRELPKEPARGAVYYIEGSKDSAKGRQWLRKRQMLNEGSAVTLTEDELNTIFTAPAPKAKAGAAEDAGFLTVGGPNFRLHDGLLQVGVPCTLTLFGVKQPVLVVATGSFRKEASGIVFDPETYYVGSLDVGRLPIASDFITRRIVATQTVPEDLAADWKKLSDVKVESAGLKLSM